MGSRWRLGRGMNERSGLFLSGPFQHSRIAGIGRLPSSCTCCRLARRERAVQATPRDHHRSLGSPSASLHRTLSVFVCERSSCRCGTPQYPGPDGIAFAERGAMRLDLLARGAQSSRRGVAPLSCLIISDEAP